MKRRYSIKIICILITFLFITMNIPVSAAVSVTSISLNKMSDVLTVNGTDTLIATVSPTDATIQTVTWLSSDTSVVNVFNGTIMGVKAGTAIITATTADGSKIAYCTVVVTSAATDVTLNKTSVALTLFGSDTLVATINKVTGTSQTVTWSSSNSAVVQVINGLILGLSAGYSIITATSVEGGNIATCYVKVSSPVISIYFNKSEDHLSVGAADTLTVSTNPSTATNQNVTWVSSNPSVVQVNEGVIIGLVAGTSIITATSVDGSKIATCTVTVTGTGTSTTTSTTAVTSISLNKTSDVLTAGATDILTATISPTTATNQTVTWSSSDTAVANVVNGVVIASSAGNAIITATSADGAKTASCVVVVNAASTVTTPVTTTTPTTTTTPVVTPSVVNTVRLGGTDRYATSVAISQAGWTGTSTYAVLATGNDYPDALSAAPLAKKYSAPILLTDKNSIPQSVQTELKRLGVTYVFITGGTGVVSQTVESQLKTMGITTERLAGTDRFQTSIKIAEKLGALSGELMVANGSVWTDALSASSIAAKKQIPIILTNKDTLPDSVSTFITKNTFSKTYILGDTDLISDTVATKFPNKDRIVGSNPYERNINILKKFDSDISFSNICIATGNDFPDALSGSALAAQQSTVIVLVDNNDLKDATTQYVSGKLTGISNAYVFGLQSAVSDEVIKKLFNK